jgi:hypothetical protein
VNRDNILRCLGSRIRLECRGINSRIPFAFFDPQMVRDVVKGGKNEGDGNNKG